MYKVSDTQGNLVRGNFASYKAAFAYLISKQRYDWKMTTNSKTTNNYDTESKRSCWNVQHWHH